MKKISDFLDTVFAFFLMAITLLVGAIAAAGYMVFLFVAVFVGMTASITLAIIKAIYKGK